MNLDSEFEDFSPDSFCLRDVWHRLGLMESVLEDIDDDEDEAANYTDNEIAEYRHDFAVWTDFADELEREVDPDEPVYDTDTIQLIAEERVDEICPQELRPYLEKNEFIDDYISDFTVITTPNGDPYYCR